MSLATNGGTEQAPWWVRFLYTFGIPATVSVYLIWLGATRLADQVASLGEFWRVHNTETAYQIRVLETMNRTLIDLHQAMVRACVNAAETAADRSACFDEIPAPHPLPTRERQP